MFARWSYGTGRKRRRGLYERGFGETGLEIRVIRLVGIYTSPNLIVEYNDGNRLQPVGISFEAEVVGGELRTSDETIDYGYFSTNDLSSVDLIEHYAKWIQDALKNCPNAIIN